MTIVRSNYELYEIFRREKNNKEKTIYKDAVNGINSINNMDYLKWKKLFNSVWNNVVLFKLIKHHERLYIKYDSVRFVNRNDLLNHKYLEYIREIRYDIKTMLQIGDLPSYGVLKEIHLYGNNIQPIDGKIIPYGVEIVYLSYQSEQPTLFSTYPSSVHTIKNATIFDHRQDINNFKMESISFKKCVDLHSSIWGESNTTIKELSFPYNWDNNGLPLTIGAIPNGVIKLLIPGFKLLHKLQKGVLPNSIKELYISCDIQFGENKTNTSIFQRFTHNIRGGFKDGKGLFDVLPSSLETLILHIHSKCVLSADSNLATTCKSLKKLIIISDDDSFIKDHTLPTSVTDLSVYGPSNLNIKFPNHIKKLTLISNRDFTVSPGYLPNSLEYFKSNKIIDKPNILPTTLTHLEINGAPRINLEMLEMMFSLLPPSVKTITLPYHWRTSKYKNIPKTVTNINF